MNGLQRDLGLTSLAATGICSMLGASVYIVPFMIQRNVPGIDSWVIPAFLFAALPALFAALAYGALGTALPEAGGSYIYASRGLNRFLGFVASFSQWFGLSIAIGVISYVIVPFFRDAALAWNWIEVAQLLENGTVRVSLALGLLWLFVWINIRGLSLYKKTLIPLMILMFVLGAVVIVVGFSYNHVDYLQAVNKEQLKPALTKLLPDTWTFLSASAVLFASFIGFDSIAQAGSEAHNPKRNIPLAIVITLGTVGGFYLLFTAAVYHTVPWYVVAEQAQSQDLTAPGLLSPVLAPALAALIILGAAIALVNDLPAMLLSVSRLLFAWSKDKIFPDAGARVHKVYLTPYVALIASGCAASLGILGSHFAGDFFLGVDIMVTSMLVNFMLICLTLVLIDRVNPEVSAKISFISSVRLRYVVGISGILLLITFLVIHVAKDLASEMPWYFKSTPIWIGVMILGSLNYAIKYKSKE